MSYSTKMAPNQHAHHFMLHGLPLEPVSRTYQYRKIMKPMLERKRRARINKCLDELKDLMTSTLQANGENLSKLEKADILELTVCHLHRLRESNGLFIRPTEALNMEKFWAGFQHCAVEVSQFLQKYDQQNKDINGDLIKYFANYIPNMATGIATTTNGAHTNTQLTHAPHVMRTSGSTANAMANHINEQYQRFSSMLRDMPLVETRATKVTSTTTPLPPPTVNLAASALNLDQKQMRISASAVSNFERIWEAATRTPATAGTRMHPYVARQVSLSRHCSGASVEAVEVSGDDSSCSSSGNAGEFSTTDGIVWRPW